MTNQSLQRGNAPALGQSKPGKSQLVIAPDDQERLAIAATVGSQWRGPSQANTTVVTISPDGASATETRDNEDHIRLSPPDSPHHCLNILSAQEETIRTATVRALCRTMRETWPVWNSTIDDTVRRALDVALERNRQPQTAPDDVASMRDALRIAMNLAYDPDTTAAIRSAMHRLQRDAPKSPATGNQDGWPTIPTLRQGRHLMVDGGRDTIRAEWSSLVCNWIITSVREWALGQLWTAPPEQRRHVHLIADRADEIRGAHWEIMVGDNHPDLISYTVCNVAPPPPGRRGRPLGNIYDAIVASRMAHPPAERVAKLLSTPERPVSAREIQTLPQGYVFAKTGTGPAAVIPQQRLAIR